MPSKTQELVQSFEAILEGAGFAMEEIGDEAEWISWRWRRSPAQWREEVVELLVRKPEQHRALANMQVCVRKEDSWVQVDGRSLTTFRSGLRSIELEEGLLGRWGWRRTKRALAEDLHLGLKWLENFSTVPKCTSMIERGSTNLGTGKAAQQVLATLREIQDSAS
jgi:hypothetical protein